MSNPLLQQFKIDQSVETEGVTLEYGEGLSFRCARPGGSNKKFLRLFEELARPYRRSMDAGVMPEGVAETMMHKVYAQAVVLGWTGVTKDVISGREEDADLELEFNTANCMAVFKALPELFHDIRKTLDQRALWLEKVREEEAGN